MKIKRISSRQWTWKTKSTFRRCRFSSPAHSSNEIIAEVLTAHDDRDEMVRGTAVAAAKLSFESDFGRSDISAAVSALCCDCGGRLDKWNVNKRLLQRARWIPNKPAGRSCCEGTRGHWDPPETAWRHTVAALTASDAGKFYRECLLNSEPSSSCSSSNLLSLPHIVPQKAVCFLNPVNYDRDDASSLFGFYWLLVMFLFLCFTSILLFSLLAKRFSRHCF